MCSLCVIFLLYAYAAAETINYTVPDVASPATLHMVREYDVNYEGATQGCKDLGGELAPASLAPDRMMKFACSSDKGGDDAGEVFVKDNSRGSLKQVLDQSSYGTAENPARDTIICDGYCKGCALSTSKKPYICCVGAGCGSTSPETPSPNPSPEISTAAMLRWRMMAVLCPGLVFLFS
eukprot:TRINITY_DN16288_c0_g1_i1.p1 TRINITY_DN16288_c0_g1~~TRINITY_DN16288_c0_g1_i1.p1  ORF type:complete len:179 (+),score=19.90 TRINITY_DN16288_c0_g1_i1:78-614(+)